MASPPLAGLPAQHGAQVDDPAVAVAGHAGDDGLRHHVGRAHLLVQLPAQFLPGDLCERLDGVRNQGVVDQHLDLAQSGPNLLDHALHGGLVAHVGRHGQRLAAGGDDRGNHIVGLLAAAAIVDHDPHSPGRQQPGCGRADPPGGAGDEGDPAVGLTAVLPAVRHDRVSPAPMTAILMSCPFRRVSPSDLRLLAVRTSVVTTMMT